MNMMLNETKQLRLDDLTPAGQMLVWAARHWVHSFVNGHMLRPRVSQSFTAIRLASVYRALGELLSILVPRELDPAGFLAGDGSLRDSPPRLAVCERALIELLLTTGGERQTIRLEPIVMVPAVRRAARAKAIRLNRALHSAGHEMLIKRTHRAAARTEPATHSCHNAATI
ncbi:MAG: hypothetical protein AAGE85_02210 [Pseudomonadota bacterium]